MNEMSWLKTLFNFSDSNTSRQIILGEVVDSILSTVNTVNSSNILLVLNS